VAVSSVGRARFGDTSTIFIYDRRAIRVCLTPSGRHVARRIEGIIERENRGFLDGLTEVQGLLLRSLLNKLGRACAVSAVKPITVEDTMQPVNPDYVEALKAVVKQSPYPRHMNMVLEDIALDRAVIVLHKEPICPTSALLSYFLRRFRACWPEAVPSDGEFDLAFDQGAGRARPANQRRLPFTGA
jgi:hypothetical protein